MKGTIVLQLLKDYLAYRKAVSDLRSLSDRELKDIGMQRHQIESILKPNYRKTIEGLFGNTKNPVEDYLAKSYDLADLERRQRDLFKKGII
jgi:uncharacterized protein YjiS (DUF1127 family)